MASKTLVSISVVGDSVTIRVQTTERSIDVLKVRVCMLLLL